MRRPALLALLAALLLLAPRLAQAEVELSLSLGAREVGVGEAVQVRLDALSDDGDAPSEPELSVPDGFEVRGPSVGTRQQVSISGFSMVTQSGISASWLVTATRPGVFTLGPATVLWKGQRRRAEAVQLSVLPAGQQPRGRARTRRVPVDPFDSFDPFAGSGFNDLFDRLGGGSRVEQLPAAPVDLVPRRALDPLAFVDARVDTRQAVVGQQVTLTIYAHGSQGLFQEAPGAREPSHPDFLAQRLVEDGGRQPVYQYSLDGQRWIAVKVRELALFPLRPGQLEIGALEFGFLGRRYGARSGEGLRRKTRPVVVEVTEPPSQGRPPGYAGDVGSFELRATVQPRAITAGGSLAVTAQVEGTGRLPGALALPEQSGVEWLQPTIKDNATLNGSLVGGTRTFTYVVRVTRAGSVDLGSLKLPLFEPGAAQYRVVTSPLGEVQVEAAPAAAAPPGGAQDGPRLSELARFRAELGSHAPDTFLTDRAGFWWLFGLGPGLVLGSAGALSLAGRVRRRRSAREGALATQAARALGEARHALAADDVRGAVAGVERALYAAVEQATLVKARAVLRADLPGELGRAGLPSELGERVAAALDACGQLRFAASDPGRAQHVLGDVEGLVKQLVRRAPVASNAGQERRPA
ncbi:MAG TPA: BatD family protein [Polyangiaceae bacterium]|nr:BatD family protein [Polyangiaceae bacterium]